MLLLAQEQRGLMARIKERKGGSSLSQEFTVFPLNFGANDNVTLQVIWAPATGF